MPVDYYGNYTWMYPASADCRHITPEPPDGSSPAYEEDDDILQSRTIGQFITSPPPDEIMLVINGASNGTTGFSN